MKDFEVKMGKHKGKQASEVLRLNKKYFRWLYHKLWERAKTEDLCFCMEGLWRSEGHDINDLVTSHTLHIQRKPLDMENIEKTKAFYHLAGPAAYKPVDVKISDITPEMEEAENNWVAENQEYININTNTN